MKRILLFLPLFCGLKLNAQNFATSQIKSLQILEYTFENDVLKKQRVSETGYGRDYLYQYDKDGKLIAEYSLPLDLKPLLLLKHEYNKQKLPVSDIKYSVSTGKIFSTTTYKYDAKNRITEQLYIANKNSAGFKNSIGTYEYNSLNKDYVYYDKVYDENKKEYLLNNTQFCKVDLNNNVIEKRFLGAENQDYYREERSKYDANNKLIEYASADEWSAFKVIYSYNHRNDCVKELQTSEGKTTETVYEYTYDQFGNWLTKKDNNGKYFERKIEYY